MEHPIFLSCCSPETPRAPGASPRSEDAGTWANVPGGRERQVVRHRLANPNHRKGGFEMAKKAKGAKKKAAKKK